MEFELNESITDREKILLLKQEVTRLERLVIELEDKVTLLEYIFKQNDTHEEEQ